MRSFVVAALIVVGVPACRDREADELAAIKTKLCKCKTAACAEDLMQQIPQRDTRSTQRTQEIARQMLDCLAKLETTPAPAGE